MVKTCAFPDSQPLPAVGIISKMLYTFYWKPLVITLHFLQTHVFGKIMINVQRNCQYSKIMVQSSIVTFVMYSNQNYWSTTWVENKLTLCIHYLLKWNMLQKEHMVESWNAPINKYTSNYESSYIFLNWWQTVAVQIFNAKFLQA